MVESESQFPLYFYGEKTKKKLHLYEVFIKKKPNVFCTTNKEKKSSKTESFKHQTNWIDEYKLISDEK